MKKFVTLGSMLLGVVFLSGCGQQSIKPLTSANVNPTSTILNTLSSTVQEVVDNGFDVWSSPSAVIFRKKLANSSYKNLSSSTEKMIRWGDFVFYNELKNYDDFDIYSYNLSTGEKRKIFNSKHDLDLENQGFWLGDMLIVNDDLYLGFASESSFARIYWSHLPAAGKFYKLSDKFSGLDVIGGRLFVSQSFGDAGEFSIELRLVNTTTKQLDPKIYFKNDSEKAGRKLVGVTDSGDFIFSQLEFKPSAGEPEEVVSSVGVIDHANLTKSTILKKSDIPFEVNGNNDVFYNQNANSLLFVGKKVALYNLTEQKFQYFDGPSDEKDGIYYFSRWDKDDVCFSTSNQKIKYKILHLSSGEIEPTKQPCIQNSTMVGNVNVADLNLPAGFEVVEANP